MSRPTCCRRIAGEPASVYFKPCGVPLGTLDQVVVGLDEIEALRLADLEGLYQEVAATQMKVSRPTFARIVESARHKVAEALVKGKVLKLEGGNVMFTTTKRFHCAECLHTWGLERGTARPTECPQCRSRNLHRAAEDRGCARLDVATRSSSCPRSRRFGKQSP